MTHICPGCLRAEKHLSETETRCGELGATLTNVDSCDSRTTGEYIGLRRKPRDHSRVQQILESHKK